MNRLLNRKNWRRYKEGKRDADPLPHSPSSAHAVYSRFSVFSHLNREPLHLGFRFQSQRWSSNYALNIYHYLLFRTLSTLFLKSHIFPLLIAQQLARVRRNLLRVNSARKLLLARFTGYLSGQQKNLNYFV